MRAIEIVNLAVEAIDAHDTAYESAFRRDDGYERPRAIEHEQVVPTLERARQIAEHMRAVDVLETLSAGANKTMYNVRPYDDIRLALMRLRSRIESAQTMAEILGPAGPQLSSDSLHAAVWMPASRLMSDGHFRSAVQLASQALEGHLQLIAGPGVSGADLCRLFGDPKGEEPRLHYAELSPDGRTATSVREGMVALIRGAMMAVRNLASHPGWPDPTEAEALEMLAVLSYIARMVDRAERQPPV